MLSQYFRYIVNANTDFVELKNEMLHIRNYFEIQRARYPEEFFRDRGMGRRIRQLFDPSALDPKFCGKCDQVSLMIGKSN